MKGGPDILVLDIGDRFKGWSGARPAWIRGEDEHVVSCRSCGSSTDAEQT